MGIHQEALQSGNLLLCKGLFPGLKAAETVDGAPPLGWAVESGSLPLAQWILSQPGVRIDASDQQGRTPLHRLLLSDSAPLSEPARLAMVNFLLSKLADPTLKDESGQSALGYAEQYLPELVAPLRRSKKVDLLVPPLRSLPPVKPWPDGTSSALKSKGIPLALLTLVGLTMAWHFSGKPQPTSEAPQLAPPDRPWKLQFQQAQEAWNKGQARLAVDFAHTALESDPDQQAQKGAVYALAAQAYLKDEDLKGAHRLFDDFAQHGPHSAELDSEMNGFRKQYKDKGDGQIAQDLDKGKAALKRGELDSARALLEVARKEAAGLGLSVPSAAWQAELAQREKAIAQKGEAARLVHRIKSREKEDAAMREAMARGVIFIRYSSPYQNPYRPNPSGQNPYYHRYPR